MTRVAAPLDGARLSGILDFLRYAERLKHLTRSAWTSTGRQESIADHSWRLSLMCLVLGGDFPGVNVDRVLRMCIVHDLGEAVHGDIPAPAQEGLGGKASQERADIVEATASLPVAQREEILGLWEEYEAAVTSEARLAKALDKLETILQHNQGMNPADFDYAFNLQYGRRFTADPPLVAALRAMLDAETRERQQAREPGADG